TGSYALVVSVYHVPEQVFTMSPDRTVGEGRGEGTNYIARDETDCISIFKPPFITPLTNTFIIPCPVIQQILSKVKQAVN
ncbi:hypothetical protein, partial [Enterobacter cloacae]|uniref:hypothetical protein n=1 Tax=Enterobacter cloacae TaxID=550 RepID=UPI002FD86A71